MIIQVSNGPGTKKTLIGTIFLQNVNGQASDHFQTAAGSFMEYFGSYQNFYSAAGWQGPYIGSFGNGPNMANSDCVIFFVLFLFLYLYDDYFLSFPHKLSEPWFFQILKEGDGGIVNFFPSTFFLFTLL